MKARCVIGTIDQLSSVLDSHVKDKLKKYDVPVVKRHVPLFYILPETGDKIMFNEITRRWKISKSSLSDIINKYEELGLISKCECSKDKRSCYISLTKEGVDIKRKLYDIDDEVLSELLSDFDMHERALLEAFLNKALESAKKM